MVDIQTLRAVAALQKRYKITRRADVYRFAVIVLATSPRLAIQPPTPKRLGRQPSKTKR